MLAAEGVLTRCKERFLSRDEITSLKFWLMDLQSCCENAEEY